MTERVNTGIRQLRQGGIAQLVIDRPEQANALDLRALEGLLCGLRAAVADDDCRLVLISAAGGRHFCAGADRHEQKSPAETVRFREALLQVLGLVRTAPKLVISAVRGSAIGFGGMLALSCDAMACTSGSRFGFPELQLGMAGDIAYTVLARSLSESAAWHLLTTGEALPVAWLCGRGLSPTLLEDEGFDSATQAWAQRLSALPPGRVADIKRLRAKTWELEA